MKKVLVLVTLLAALCTFALTSPQPSVMPLSSPDKNAPEQVTKKEATSNPVDAAAMERARVEEARKVESEMNAAQQHGKSGSLDNCAIPFPEGFEGNGTTLPACWQVFDVNNDLKTWTVYTSSGWQHGGTYHLRYTYHSTNVGNDWAISPAVNLTGGTTYALKFWERVYSSSNPEMCEILYGTSQTVAGMTNVITAVQTYTNATYAQVTYTFVPAASGTYYIGWHDVSAANKYYLALDDITLDAIVPDNFATTSITNPLSTVRYDPSASVPVTAVVQNMGTATEAATVSYQLAGGAIISEPTGVLAPNATETHTFATPVTLPAADGTYLLKVWTDLAGDVYHNNDTSSVSVRVLNCTTQVPNCQNFDAIITPNLPDCWATGGTAPLWRTTATNHTTPNAITSYYVSSTQRDAWLWSPAYSLTGGVAYQLKFWYKLESATYPQTMEIKYGAGQNAPAMTEVLLAGTAYTSASWVQVIYSFTPVASGNYNIGYHMITGTANSYYGFFMDDACIQVAPATGRCCYLDANHHGACADNLEADCNALGGSWTAGLTCATDPCQTGRCCYANYSGCGDLQQIECTYLAGNWTAGLTCAANACPPPPPANDLCANAIPVAIPSQTAGTTVGGSEDTAPSCIVSSSAPNVWYTMVGNDHRVTVGTCTSSYDTQIRIFTGTCGSLTCVTGDDDACDSPNGNGSRATFCTDLGVTYYIMVGGWSGANGTFTLDVADGDNCHINCATYAPCGTPTETESNNTCQTVDAQVLTCDATVYGTICPVSDVDYYSLDVPPMKVLTVSLYDGDACVTTPAVISAVDILNDTCGTISANQHTGWAINNPTANTLYYKLKVHGDGQNASRYRLAVTCCDVTNYLQHPIVIGPGFHFQQVVNTCCATVAVDSIYGGGCGLGTLWGAGPGVIFRYTIESAAQITMSANGTADLQIYVFTDPANPKGSCVGSRDAGNPETLTFAGMPAGTYYVQVDVYSSTHNACGNITFTIDSDVALPVELDGAPAATAGDASVMLNWATASETSNSRFDIVRNDHVVGRVEGAGTSPVRHTYRFTDTGLANGTTYTYTLRSIAVDGSSHDLASVSATPTYGAGMVTEYALRQNYPNPFNPTTSIALDLVEGGFVSLKVYNLMGQEVASLVNNAMDQGRHVVSFDASNLSSGIYLYRLSVNGFVAEKKMLLMK
ncbi:MAG TPA: choice-of-anchor J domain-containing protein [bacterium]|jgi:hypothetical protein